MPKKTSGVGDHPKNTKFLAREKNDNTMGRAPPCLTYERESLKSGVTDPCLAKRVMVNAALPIHCQLLGIILVFGARRGKNGQDKEEDDDVQEWRKGNVDVG